MLQGLTGPQFDVIIDTYTDTLGNKMTSIFIVRAEDRGAPESIIYGVYPTAKLASARVLFLRTDEAYGHEYVWFDEVKVGAEGADCELANR